MIHFLHTTVLHSPNNTRHSLHYSESVVWDYWDTYTALINSEMLTEGTRRQELPIVLVL